MRRSVPERGRPPKTCRPSRLRCRTIEGRPGADARSPASPTGTSRRPVPRARLLEVAEHYGHFGGVSPLNGQVRALIAALRPELDRHGIALPIYWGNRNWHPLLPDTLRAMTAAGVRRAQAVVLAAYS